MSYGEGPFEADAAGLFGHGSAGLTIGDFWDDSQGGGIEKGE